MDELRCAFCDDNEAEAGRLYKYDVRPDSAPPRPPTRICAECSEMINFMIRTRLVHEGRVFEPDAEFPPIASHKFALRGPSGQEAEAVVQIAAPYTVDDHKARCPLSITGPMPIAWHHVGGASTLQALSLALSFAYDVVKELGRQGWQWVDPYPDLEILFGRRSAVGRDDS